MSYEAIGALAAAGTFIVITATAVAALIQLRHMRVSNQLEILLTLIHMPLEPKLNEAFNFCSHDLARLMEDDAFRDQLEKQRPLDRTVHKELYVCDYYERIGSAIKYGLISAAMYLDNSSPLQYWHMLGPAIALMRRERGPWVYENFEYLAMIAQRWDSQHPAGNYPPGEPRLKLDEWKKKV